LSKNEHGLEWSGRRNLVLRLRSMDFRALPRRKTSAEPGREGAGRPLSNMARMRLSEQGALLVMRRRDMKRRWNHWEDESVSLLCLDCL
jgi:hypothetical protein